MENPHSGPPPSSETSVIKRKKPHPKSRSGCITCKQRRVKCGEQKPKCHRCIAAGITCQGYASSAPSSPTRSEMEGQLVLEGFLAKSLPDLPDWTTDEKRLFSIYNVMIAPHIGGSFHQEFWNKKIVILSLSEPTVRTALVAFASMYEIETTRRSSTSIGAQTEVFIGYYNQAIRQLVTHLNSPWPARAPLTISILFFCIDILRGDLTLAMKHLRGGLELYQRWKAKSESELIADNRNYKLDAAFFDDQVVFMLNWLNMLSATFGERTIDLNTSHEITLDCMLPTKEENYEPFDNIHQAQAALVGVIDNGLRVLQTVGPLASTMFFAMFNSGSVSVQSLIFDYLAPWDQKFEQMVSNNWETWSDSNRQAARITRSGFLTVKLWVKGASFKLETDWDQCRDEFAEILVNIREYLDGLGSHEQQPHALLSFEVSTLPPLHLILAKCRYPSLRRLALALLRLRPDREALFDSVDSEVLYDHIMKVEEAGIVGLADGQIPQDDQLPPDCARVYKIEIPPIVTINRGTTVNLFFKPDGLKGPWEVKALLLDLQSPQLLRAFDGRFGDWKF